MAYVIRIMGFANGQACPLEGEYLKHFDPEDNDGQGYVETTTDPKQALQFIDFAEAFMFWKQSPKCRPTREDGKPNRPLTASTITIERVK